MNRLARPMSLFLLLLAATSCHHRGWRRSSRRARRPRAAAPAAPAPSAPSPAASPDEAPRGIRASTAAVFSSPIAAVRSASATIVAGFVAKESAVRVTALGPGGALWTLDAVRDVTWAPDAEVKLESAGDNVVLLWRSGRAERHAGILVVVGSDGAARGTAQDVGVAECATDDGLAWIDPGANGPYRVRGRAWADATAHDRLSVPMDRTPTLVCDERSVFVLGDGDDDLTAARVDTSGVSDGAQVVIRGSDFPDDELEHDAFAVDGKLELLRISNAGGLATREVPVDGPPTPWRKLKHHLSEDDDVVAVDGDATTTLAVYTQEAEDACSATASPALRVRALRVNRVTGADSVADLAAPSCEQTPSPIWIATPHEAPPIVAWVERGSRTRTGMPPIRALAYRVLEDGKVPRSGRVAILAETVVDAGCRDGTCTAAALVSPPDGDAMAPMSIAVFDYP
jgi:hypothetical protein